MGAVALQAPLLADKATLAGDATEDLLAIDTRQHHGDEASSALPADLKQAPLGAVFYACPHCHAQKR